MTTMGESKSYADLDKILSGAVVHSKAEAIRDHDVYARTRTMPNQELKLIEITVNSSLYF